MKAILFNEYTFLLWWIALMAVTAQILPVTTTVDVLGKKEKRVTLFFAAAAFFPVFRLAAFGPIIGDVGTYLSSYSSIPDSLSDFIATLKDKESGYAYEVIEYLIKRVSGGDTTAYRVTIALIHAVPVVLILRRYSENYLLSVFLFVAGTYHIAWMMNGLRQFVAAVIIFLAFPLLLRRRYIPLVLIILLASLFHLSALVMLPVIFVVRGRTWNWKTLLSILAAVVATLIFNRNAELFDVLVENTEYEGAVNTWRAMGDDGVNPLRVLVHSLPMIIAFIGRKRLPQDDPVVNVCVNMSVITTGIYLVAMVTSGIMVGRLPVYTSLYNLILLPSLIRRVFNRDSARIMTLLMVAFYLAYYFYATH